MKLLDRLMAIIAAILLVILSLMAFSSYVGGYVCIVGDWLNDLLMTSWFSAFMLEVLVVLVAAYLLEMALRTSKGMGRLLKRTTESGDIFVSVGTIETFARNLALEVEGVQSVDINAKAVKEGLDLILKVTASKGAVLPEMSAKLESRIREALPAQSGFPVNSVKSYIRSAS